MEKLENLLDFPDFPPRGARPWEMKNYLNFAGELLFLWGKVSRKIQSFFTTFNF